MIKTRRGKTKRPDNAGKGKSFNRDTVLQDLHDMLTAMSNKVVRGRIKNQATFDLQLRALKSFAYGCSVFSGVLDASENSLVLSRLTALEDRIGGSEKNDKREE